MKKINLNFLAGLIFLIIVFSVYFYWNYYRPSKIIKECNNFAFKEAQGDLSSEWYRLHFKKCELDRGLE